MSFIYNCSSFTVWSKNVSQRPSIPGSLSVPMVIHNSPFRQKTPDIQFCNILAGNVISISVVELLWMLVDVLSGGCAADLLSHTVSMLQSNFFVPKLFK